MSFNQPGLSQKKIANYPKDIIYFGQGGGFAGIETTYALLESGDLYNLINPPTPISLLSMRTKHPGKNLYGVEQKMSLET